MIFLLEPAGIVSMGTVDGGNEVRNLSELDSKNEIGKSKIPVEQGNGSQEFSAPESLKSNRDEK